jgi:DNA-binding beta-propeller fold protein YncE
VDPFGIAADNAGTFYIVEMNGNRILAVDKADRLTVLAGTGKKGPGDSNGDARKASFNGPHSIAVGPDGMIYVADTLNNRIRRIDPTRHEVAAFAGTGTKGATPDGTRADKANFGGIYSIAFNADGSKLYLVDLDSRRIHAVDMKTKAVTLIAGNGKKGIPDNGANARTSPLVDPRAVAVDRKNNVYILERSGNALRVVDAVGKIYTVVNSSGTAGSDDGAALKATMRGPKHLCIDADDNVIIADSANHLIRKYVPKESRLVRLAGTGKKGASGDGGEALAVDLDEPHGVYVTPAGALYIVDSLNHRIFRMTK